MPTQYSISEIVRFAIEIEKEGTIFYQKMHEKTDNKELKALFLTLKTEELEHQQAFENILESLGPDQNEYKFHLENEYVGYLHAIIENEIFNKKNTDQLMEQFQNNIDILDYALQKENNSIKYYTNLKQVCDSKFHPTIDILIGEEELHAKKLLEIKNQIK